MSLWIHLKYFNIEEKENENNQEIGLHLLPVNFCINA